MSTEKDKAPAKPTKPTTQELHPEDFPTPAPKAPITNDEPFQYGRLDNDRNS